MSNKNKNLSDLISGASEIADETLAVFGSLTPQQLIAVSERMSAKYRDGERRFLPTAYYRQNEHQFLLIGSSELLVKREIGC